MESIKLIGYVSLIISTISIIIAAIINSKSVKNYKNLHPIRKRTIQLLKQIKVPFAPHLPMYCEPTQEIVRTKEQIFNRLLALYVSSGYASSLGALINISKVEQEKSVEELKKYNNALILKYGLHKSFTKEEITLLTSEFNEKDEEFMQLAKSISWGIEAIFVLAFALGFEKYPPLPEKEHDPTELMAKILNIGTVQNILEIATLAKKEEVHAWLDVFFELQWACNDVKYYNKKPIKGISPSAVMESFRALIWLVNKEEGDWYNIDLSA